MNRIAAGVLGGVLLAGWVSAADAPKWPQFRGPNGSGVADSEKPPVEFGPDKNLKWKVPVPSGFSSPVVAADKLFLTAFDDGKLFTVAYSTTNGKELYANERSAAAGRYYASPVAANGHIYTVTLDDGEFTVFKAGEDSADVVTKNPKLGERVAATPAIVDDTIYVRGGKHLWAFAETPK